MVRVFHLPGRKSVFSFSIFSILTFIVLISILLYQLNRIARLVTSHRKARNLQVPIFLLPVLQDGVLWQLTKPFLRAIIYRPPLSSLFRWNSLVPWDPEWRFVAKHQRLHAKYGDLFMIVSPGDISLEVADAHIAAQVIYRSKSGFLKPKWPYYSSVPALPPHTRVNLSVSALHSNPKYWGTGDVRTTSTEPEIYESGAPTDGVSSASTRTPKRGSYLPFSDGARGCLGKRFSQVEYLAVMTVIFCEFRVELTLEGDMSWEDARAKAQRVLDDSITLPTLTMREPVPLRCS
ncbi:hypothetical protein BJX64DRAFT_290315 [Aspergillus heterothallicus]